MRISEEIAHNSPRIFLTGTRAYGPARPDSDFDIVVPEIVAVNMFGILGHITEVELTSDVEEYTGYTFDVSGYKVNVISCKTEEELENWRRATEAMKNLDPIEDRETRVELFKSIRDGEDR
jgi:hypothetical protein